MREKTGWMTANKKPIRIGVYETSARDDTGQVSYQYYNGDWWGCFDNSVDEAWRWRRERSMFQNVKWRGLVGKP